MSETQQQQIQPKPEATHTEYVVLERRVFVIPPATPDHDAGDVTAWVEVGKVAGAGTDKALITKWAKQPGHYKLVAARSWKRDGVTLAEKTTLAAM